VVVDVELVVVVVVLSPNTILINGHPLPKPEGGV
jgi:hypothetical protein